MENHCPQHDAITRELGGTAEFQKNTTARLVKIEAILTGNGSGGLIRRVARISALMGAGGGVAMLIIAAVVRYVILQ